MQPTTLNQTFQLRLAVFLLLVHCQAVAAANSLIKDITRSGRASCQPALKFYCENIHVGCAGQSKISTTVIEISFSDQAALIYTKPVEHTQSSTIIAESVIWAPNSEYVLLWIHQGADYIKILADGKFNHRRYTGSNALMAYGTCTAD